MKKILKWFLGLLLLACVLIYIGNYILWGVGMGTIHNPQLSRQGQEFTHEFNLKYPKISFYFMHHFDIEHIPEKNESAEIILEPLDPSYDFKKWSTDSLSNFSNQLNTDFQRVLNYKQAYDSVHIYFLYYKNRITYKDYSYPVK